VLVPPLVVHPNFTLSRWSTFKHFPARHRGARGRPGGRRHSCASGGVVRRRSRETLARAILGFHATPRRDPAHRTQLTNCGFGSPVQGCPLDLKRTVPQKFLYEIVGSAIQSPCDLANHRFTFIPCCCDAGESAPGARERCGGKGKSRSLGGFHDEGSPQGCSIATLGLLQNNACLLALYGREE
jgi:hypothetical protein